MKAFENPAFRLGILGGGQLGKMLVLAAHPWDVRTVVLDPSDSAPCNGIATDFVQGDFRDEETVYAFGKGVDVLTIEIEQINVDALEQLKKEGVEVHPDPAAIRIIQDKGIQKDFYASIGVPTSPYRLFASADEIRKALQSGELSYPFVQKKRTEGYDGRGVSVINSVEDTERLLESPSVVEDKIAISKEIAVIVAKGPDGTIEAFPPVEMVFNETANLVDYLACPANLSEQEAARATEIAVQVLSSLNMNGVLAVEMFVDIHGKIWVNESAPRPHNSGHHTIESCFTSQFQQHLRSILSLPLGSTKLKMPSVMVNLLGEPGYEGPVDYEGIDKILNIGGVYLHLYGKSETRPYRKMGHATILDPDPEKALEKARKVRESLRIISTR